MIFNRLNWSWNCCSNLSKLFDLLKLWNCFRRANFPITDIGKFCSRKTNDSRWVMNIFHPVLLAKLFDKIITSEYFSYKIRCEILYRCIFVRTHIPRFSVNTCFYCFLGSVRFCFILSWAIFKWVRSEVHKERFGRRAVKFVLVTLDAFQFDCLSFLMCFW